MSMTKKAAIGVGGVVLVGLLLFGTRFFGYVSQIGEGIQQAANDAVPFSMKIKEAKKIVAALDGEIQNHEKRMAVTLAERQTLDKSIAKTSKRVGDLDQELVYLSGVLENSDSEFVSVNTSDGQQKKSRAEVETKLASTLNSFENAQRSLTVDKKNREREQSKYEQYQKYYNELVAKRDNLKQRIKELESKQAELETRKATEASQFDDSAIKDAEDFLNKLEKEQSVENNLLDIQKNHGTFDVEPNAEEQLDILERVRKARESNAKPSEVISIDS